MSAKSRAGEPAPEVLPSRVEVGEAVRATIRELREARGLSRAELADAAGLKRPTIAAYEQGGRQPEVWALARLAIALDAPIAALAPWGGRETTTLGVNNAVDHQERLGELDHQVRAVRRSMPRLVDHYMFTEKAQLRIAQARRGPMSGDQYSEWCRHRAARDAYRREKGWRVESIAQVANLFDFASARGPFWCFRLDGGPADQLELLEHIREVLERQDPAMQLALITAVHRVAFVLFDRRSVHIESPGEFVEDYDPRVVGHFVRRFEATWASRLPDADALAFVDGLRRALSATNENARRRRVAALEHDHYETMAAHVDD